VSGRYFYAGVLNILVAVLMKKGRSSCSKWEILQGEMKLEQSGLMEEYMQGITNNLVFPLLLFFREWIAVATATFLLDKIVDVFKTNDTRCVA
jgi:hypothetical protein